MKFNPFKKIEEVKQSREEERERVKREAEILGRLNENDDFQWYLENVVAPAIENMRVEALNQDLTTEEGRQNAIANLNAWKKVRGIFKTVFEMFDAEVKRMLEE